MAGVEDVIGEGSKGEGEKIAAIEPEIGREVANGISAHGAPRETP